jgi:NDP-sugar pyrophosphorylase family protein
MKGMILAAGFGSRLGELTKETPKALIEYKGKPLIEYQIEKLIKCGADEIVVNAHHHSEKIFRHFDNNNYGIRISVLKEEKIMGTGGGIINAGQILNRSETSVILNTDIVTNFDLQELIEPHLKENNFVTLLVQKRKTSRYLKFDNKLNLVSRSVSERESDDNYAFNGIHILSKRFFEIEHKPGYSDIIDVYLGLIKNGYVISGYDAVNSIFKDIGKPENFF